MSGVGLRERERIRVVAGSAELARAAARLVLAHAAEALERRGAFHLALSGGSTPLGAYRELAGADGLERWHVWFGDERCVPADDPRSNFRAAEESGLLARLPDAHVHRVRGEASDAGAEAERYARELVAALGEPPRLDLALLGLGADGHTASLFPGAPEASGWIAATSAPDGAPVHGRVTMTLATLENARALAFLVAGADKSAALAAALDESARPVPPARRARPLDGPLVWLVDAAAAGRTKRDRA